jgi:hypothetical protein
MRALRGVRRRSDTIKALLSRYLGSIQALLRLACGVRRRRDTEKPAMSSDVMSAPEIKALFRLYSGSIKALLRRLY